MEKYIYKIVAPDLKGWPNKKIDNEGNEKLLTELGAEGWELVSVVMFTGNMGVSYGGTTSSLAYYLKKRVPTS